MQPVPLLQLAGSQPAQVATPSAVTLAGASPALVNPVRSEQTRVRATEEGVCGTAGASAAPAGRPAGRDLGSSETVKHLRVLESAHPLHPFLLHLYRVPLTCKFEDDFGKFGVVHDVCEVDGVWTLKLNSDAEVDAALRAYPTSVDHRPVDDRQMQVMCHALVMFHDNRYIHLDRGIEMHDEAAAAAAEAAAAAAAADAVAERLRLEQEVFLAEDAQSTATVRLFEVESTCVIAMKKLRIVIRRFGTS